MSEETNANADRDELNDRLIDRGLREVVGGEAPPELTQRICTIAAAAGTPVVTAASRAAGAQASARSRSGFGWSMFAIAVCLLVAVGYFLTPRIQGARESALRNPTMPEATREASTEPVLPESGHKPIATDQWRAKVTSETLAEGLDSSGDRQANGEATDMGVAVGTSEEAAPDFDSLGTLISDQAGQGEQGGGQQQGAGDGAVELRLAQLGDLEGQPAGGRSYELRVLNENNIAGNDATQWAAPRGDAYYNESEAVAAAGAPPFPNYTDDLALVPRVQPDRRYLRPELLAQGRGPGSGGDQYAPIIENPFQAISPATTDNRLSTFSIDVDTASYANVRQFLMDSHMLPPPDAVRIEELVNYFDYDYSPPTGDVPFAAHVEVAGCPWAPEHRLVRVGIKGREMERDRRPKSNLVFLVDVSGSMDEPNKLPLVLEGLRMLTRELGENDRIAIVVYASTEGLVLDSTRGDKQQTILDALNRLSAGGSTAGGAGIVLAYKVAEENFIKDGTNRVILCTDGDFNVGVTSTGDLQRLAEDKAKNTGVFLTVLGFGRGNLNDAMMEAVADHGNGNYHYVDNRTEARKVLVEEMTGTLVTIAKDVKIQIEFNPAQVAGYRLIGYENRVLAAEDFNDDKKDAGEIGAGHTVTALYEIVPAGQKVDASQVDELKYAPVASADGEAAASPGGEDAPDRYADDADGAIAKELLTLKIRYKAPDGDESTKLEFPITDSDESFSKASADFQFASAVASFGMLLRGSQYKGEANFAGVLEIAEAASRERDPHGYRREFRELVTRAKELAGY